MADKRFLEGLLGSGENYDTNMLRGLLGLAIGSLQGNTTSEALAGGLAGGVQQVDAGRKMQADAAFRRFQMSQPQFQGPGTIPFTFNERTGKHEKSGPQAPFKTELKTRNLSLEGDMIQPQQSHDGGLTWENVGQPYDRREPFVMQETRQEDGTVVTKAIPRSMITSALRGQPQAGAQSSTPAPSGPGVVVGSKAPDKLTPEQSARVALVQEGVSAVDGVSGSLLKDGKVDRTLLVSMWANLPSTDGRRLRNLLENAVGNRVRLETGAAINKEEIPMLMRRYAPHPLDDDATVKQKLEGLRGYFKNFADMSKGNINVPDKAKDKPKVRVFNPATGKLE